MALRSMFRVVATSNRLTRGLACLSHISLLEDTNYRSSTTSKIYDRSLWTQISVINRFQSKNARLLQTEKQSTLKNNSSDEELFDEEFKNVLQFLTSKLKDLKILDVANKFQQMMIYNVPHGKKNRGLGVIQTYKYLKPQASEEDRRLAFVLGWCVEMLQAFFLVLDDIMDQSTTRRGMPCWFRQEEVGFMAVNDSILIESALYQLLKGYLSHHPNYINIVDLFHETTHYTSSGQSLDMLSTPDGTKINLNKLTLERHTAISQLKTGYYTFCLPVRLALLLAGQGDLYTKEVESLLLDVGYFFQVQDDFLDSFGDPATTGKKGTDIIDGKCAWPIVMALQRVTSDDRLILQENFGHSNPESVEKVMAIYRKVNIPSLYETFENEMYNSICKQIESVTKNSKIPVEVFYGLVNKVYKRSK